MSEEIQSKILDVLNRSRKAGAGELTEDTIKAVIAIDNDITTSEALRTLLLEGKVTAEFLGTGEDNALDLDLYSFKRRVE